MAYKVYMEITNCCNLSCSFCPGTKRERGRMSLAAFDFYTDQVKDHADYLYFHLMGEPLTHPDLPAMLALAREKGMKPIITTNGTLLTLRAQALLSSPVHKVSISLHAFEANEGIDFDAYLSSCLSFAKQAAEREILCALRLWNLNGGRQEKNDLVLSALHEAFLGKWKENRSGYQLCPYVYLEWGSYFDWPDLSLPSLGKDCFCYGLRDQVGVLCDGRVVPCCLDKDGDLVLGDLNRQSLAQILHSPLARAIYDGFSAHRASQALCERCGFAHTRLKKKEKC